MRQSHIRVRLTYMPTKVTITSLCPATWTYAKTWQCPHLQLCAALLPRGAAIERYLLPAGPTAANPPHVAAAGAWDGWTDRETNGRTPYRYIYRASRTMRAVPIMRAFIYREINSPQMRDRMRGVINNSTQLDAWFASVAHADTQSRRHSRETLTYLRLSRYTFLSFFFCRRVYYMLSSEVWHASI